MQIANKLCYGCLQSLIIDYNPVYQLIRSQLYILEIQGLKLKEIQGFVFQQLFLQKNEYIFRPLLGCFVYIDNAIIMKNARYTLTIFFYRKLNIKASHLSISRQCPVEDWLSKRVCYNNVSYLINPFQLP